MNARALGLVIILSSTVLSSATLLGVAQAQISTDVNLDLSDTQQARVRDIGLRLRCLVCQGESVTDSRSPFAFEVKRQIGDFIKGGRSDSDIVGFFQTRYGDTILLEPPKKGINWILWGLPVIALFGGAALWWGTMGRKNRVEVSPEMLERVEQDMRERSREEPRRTTDSSL